LPAAACGNFAPFIAESLLMPSPFRPALLALFFLPALALAQPRAQECFFQEDFETADVPEGWEFSWVERTTPGGEPLGEWVPAWRIANAAQARVGGFFPVPDEPIGNRFIMANDDAPPCPCDFADATLTTPLLDLSDRQNVVLEFRVFHDMLLGGGEALVEASPNGTDWYLLHTIPAQEASWQYQTVGLAAWSGNASVWIRFRWSDNGQWASGIALDDVCLRERAERDLTVVDVFTGDPTVSPFAPAVQSLRYSMLPLEQAGPFSLGAEVVNTGTGDMTNVSVTFTLALDGVEQGSFTMENEGALAPGARATLVTQTTWTPSASGELTVTAVVSADEEDEDPSDNSGIGVLRITGPGWEDGYSAMALDAGQMQGSTGGSNAFITGCRYELVNSGTARGISVVIDPATEPGAEIRAVLFDAGFAVIDTSYRHTITSEEIDQAWGGAPIYLPLVLASPLPAGDVLAGVQRISSVGPVLIATSGTAAPGAAFRLMGTTFELEYPMQLPMVRLHFSDVGVGLHELAIPSLSVRVAPNPVSGTGEVIVELPGATTVQLEVVDLAGRKLKDLVRLSARSGQNRLALGVHDLSPGTYFIRAITPTGTATTRFIISGR
jgi:hypothetical protein